MCGRYNIIDDPLTRFIMEITGQTFSVATHYNIAPTEQVPVLIQDETGWQLLDMRWWLVPSWSDGPSTKYSMFNAKSETLARSRAFREPFSRRRCIIPASGYYEWQKDGKVKVPHYITPADAPGFAFAGLWDRWQDGASEIYSCTIITAAAPANMTDIHHRIPVHLAPEQIASWVNADTSAEMLKALLAPTLRVPVNISPVSSIVNNARNKDPRCVELLGEARQALPSG